MAAVTDSKGWSSAGSRVGGLARTQLGAFVIAAFCLSMSGCAGDEEPSTPQPDMAAINALGYVSWAEITKDDQGKTGVTRFDESRSQPGLNLWNSLPHNRAILMDSHGEVLHTWEHETDGEWGHIELLGNGDLLVFHQGPNRLIRLDWESNVVWEKPMLANHDADVSERGEIFVLDTRRQLVQAGPERVWVSKEFIVVLGPDGAYEREISFFKMLRDRIDLEEARVRAQAKQAKKRIPLIDPMHINTLSIIREDHNEVLRKGGVLFAARNLSLIGVVDVEREKVVWSWGEKDLDWPHQPVISRSGTILIFDNGTHRGYSRVVEIDPLTGEIVWEYRGDPVESFYSDTMGGIQLLANDNILVTESTRGRVFEITRSGQVVWEYFNPTVENEERATIYRMVRIGEDALPEELWQRLSALSGT